MHWGHQFAHTASVPCLQVHAGRYICTILPHATPHCLIVSRLCLQVHWGHQFAQIVMKPGGENTCYNIDLNK